MFKHILKVTFVISMIVLFYKPVLSMPYISDLIIRTQPNGVKFLGKCWGDEYAMTY